MEACLKYPSSNPSWTCIPKYKIVEKGLPKAEGLLLFKNNIFLPIAAISKLT